MAKSFIKITAVLIVSVLTLTNCGEKETTRRPNVVLVLTDDQGIGDIGYNGNNYIKTPTLDRLASESVRLTNFYVSPVCAPTRASIMTGRYSEKTGVFDTFNGGAVMSTSEITLAEILKKNGYKTGIFGKWHLGDNYPHRPSDQGFVESLIHKGGGLGQPGDVANVTKSYTDSDNHYFNPILYKNNVKVETEGYCSDIFTDSAIEFIKENKESPFFTFLSFNAPHIPLQVPEKYLRMYNNLKLDADDFIESAPLDYQPTEMEIERAKRVYAMVSNIDDNIDRLVRTLEEEDLIENTIFIFMSDNGPQNRRYKMGLRDTKGTVYEGGIKVPFFIKYPAALNEPREINTVSAHIDLLPTILDFCNIDFTNPTDGNSLFNLLMNNDDGSLKDRTLFFEWGRGMPRKYHNVAVRRGDLKLVGNTGYESDISKFELYNLKEDPFERNNLIETENVIARKLKDEFDMWMQEIIDSPNNRKTHPSIIGTKYENPLVLNRNDVKGYPNIWRNGTSYGSWDVEVLETAKFNFKFKFIDKIKKSGAIYLRLYPHHNSKAFISPEDDHFIMENIEISKGIYSLEAFFLTSDWEYITPFSIEIERIN